MAATTTTTKGPDAVGILLVVICWSFSLHAPYFSASKTSENGPHRVLSMKGMPDVVLS